METKQDGQPLAGGLGSVAPLVRELCAAVADLGGTLTAAERTWALLRLVVLSGLLSDPKRTELLAAEWRRAGPIQSWVYRHLLIWRCFVFGGLGLIADTTIKGLRLEPVDPGLAGVRRLDGVGVVVIQGLMLTLAMAKGVFWRYLLFWLVLERVIGAIIQFRGLVEHQGLWVRESTHLLTQIYGSRDVQAGTWLNSLMGGLPHHSAHHAFPWIPSPRLPVASERIAAVLCSYGQRPVPKVTSYFEAPRQLRSVEPQPPIDLYKLN